jgi:hypothetical protein
MKHHAVSVMLGLFLILSSLRGQDMEDLWEASGDDPSLRQHFEYLAENPIDLNCANAEQLQELLFLDPLQINTILQYRNHHYPLSSPDELLNIPGISPEMYRALQTYLTVAPFPKSHGIHGQILSRFYRRYPHSRGYSENIYHGNPMGMSHSLELEQGNLTWGVVVQKDPGESHWDDHQALFVRADGVLTQNDYWVLGNYRLGFGQGLVLSNGYRLASTTADPEAILTRRAIGVREYYSTGEFGYFQGAAYQNQFHHLTSAVFLSRIFLDASVDDNGEVGTIQTTGLHRTITEESNREQLCEDLWGSHLEVSTNIASIGVTGYRAEYQPHLNPGDPVTQHFRLQGSENSVLGVNGSFHLDSGAINAEVAKSQSGGKAFLIEGKYSITSVQTSCIYHRYDPNFQNMYAVTLTEWGEEAQNEEGWLLALSTPLWRGALLSSRADITRTLWRTYTFPFSRQGAGVVIAIDQSLGLKHTVGVRLRSSQVDDLKQDAIIRELRSSIRAQWDWQENKTRSYRLRWERVQFDTPTSLESGIGWMGYGQMTVGVRQRLSAKCRLVTFDVPVYGARIYAFEDDLPGRLVNQLFYGSGRRLTCYLKYTIAAGWNFWLKAGVTSYDGVNEIASGWDEISASNIYDLGIALEWKGSTHRH